MVYADVAKSVDAADFDDWSARVGKPPVQNRSNSGKALGARARANPEPSPLTGEGVETRRVAPTACDRLRGQGQGEGIVQTTNGPWPGGESRSGMKICFPNGSAGSSPAVRTITPVI